MPRPTGFALERFVRPRESARGQTNRASADAQLAVRARAARPYAEISRSAAIGWIAFVGLLILLNGRPLHVTLYPERQLL